MKLLRLTNCLLLRNHNLVKEDLWVKEGKITEPAPDCQDVEVVDCAGALVAPGFIDIQINGGFGVDFTSDIIDEESCEAALAKVGVGILGHGVTSYCPTIVTSPATVFRTILSHIKKSDGGGGGASVLGAHVEGPFISAEKRGAHNEEYLQGFSNGVDTVEDFYGTGMKNISIVTLAPELEHAGEVIENLTKRGIQVSIGHSAVGFEDAKVAVKRGARLVTHLFNGMSGFHHRDPGLLGLLLCDELTPWFSIIADGVHTHPLAVKLAYKTNFSSLVLVTDAIRAMGFKDGVYRSGQQDMEVRGGRATVAGTNTLIGSVVTMHDSVINLIKFTGCSVVEALEAASLHPATALGIQNSKGTLNIGSDADFVILGYPDADLPVLSTWIGGKSVFTANIT